MNFIYTLIKASKFDVIAILTGRSLNERSLDYLSMAFLKNNTVSHLSIPGGVQAGLNILNQIII
jgi:hypothetical protein